MSANRDGPLIGPRGRADAIPQHVIGIVATQAIEVGPVQQMTGVGPSGMAIDAVHKELIVTSGNRNRVMTFSLPEVF